MSVSKRQQCRCSGRGQEIDGPDEVYQREIRAFLATLNDQQQRLYAAVESRRVLGSGVKGVSQITGISPHRIARGKRELADLLDGRSLEKPRKPGCGRKRTEEKHPEILAASEAMLSDEIAGSPEGERPWIRSSCRKLAEQLNKRGFVICYRTVWKMLKRMGFSMKTHVRSRRGLTSNPAERDAQFSYIARKKQEFRDAGLPVISVDTKKKELIGNFRNPGRTWCRKPREVEEFHFASRAECLAVPFGIYDLAKNTGYVVVGLSYNTSEFAVCSIVKWWESEGRTLYAGMDHILILADGGGANGSSSRAWRWNLQRKFCDPFGMTVTVCHYPVGCSKWNPVEYKLFSQIANNWAGTPLRSLTIMLGFIRGTTTAKGLTVKAVLDEGTYTKGQGKRISWKDVDSLNLTPHEICPEWNYTIRPAPCVHT